VQPNFQNVSLEKVMRALGNVGPFEIRFQDVDREMPVTVGGSTRPLGAVLAELADRYDLRYEVPDATTLLISRRGAGETAAPERQRPDEVDAERLYAEALAALDAGNPRVAETKIGTALGALPPDEPRVRVSALKLLARYELRTGRVEAARGHLVDAVRAAERVYREGHPELLELRRMLEEAGGELVTADADR
jgi:hypothetical protein